MATISKRFHFEAAHMLPGHKGACARPHGHSYEFDIIVEGPIKPGSSGKTDAGFVVDFQDITDVMKPIIDEYLDHYNLNDTIQGNGITGNISDPTEHNMLIPRTTAELIACWIYGSFTRRFKGNYTSIEVQLWETRTSSVIVGRVDWERAKMPGLA